MVDPVYLVFVFPLCCWICRFSFGFSSHLGIPEKIPSLRWQ